MPVPPDDSTEPVDGTEAPLDFDPYRFGKPDHPIPPEYAPPGYVPPPVTEPPPVGPAYGTPVYPPPNYAPPASPQFGPPPTGPAYPGQQGYPGQYPVQPGYPAGAPGMYPPVPPQFHPDYPQPRTSNGRAIASLVLGILSIVLCVASFLDFIPIVLALVFGFTVRAEAKRNPARGGSGLALGGIICAGIGAVLAIVLTLVYVHIAHACAGIPSNSSAYSDCVRSHL